MKVILILTLLMAANAHAGWFSDSKENEQRVREYQQALQTERQSRDRWQLIAGVCLIGGVLLFTLGTALGSRTRRDANK